MLLPAFLHCLGWLHFGSDQSRIQIFGHMKPQRVWMFLVAQTRTSTQRVKVSAAHVLTATTWSVTSSCCDAPLSSQVPISFRGSIRLLTPAPNSHIRGGITQWKLTGWYHSASTPLWWKHESIQQRLTVTWYHSQESSYSQICCGRGDEKR